MTVTYHHTSRDNVQLCSLSVLALEGSHYFGLKASVCFDGEAGVSQIRFYIQSAGEGGRRRGMEWKSDE